MTRSVDYFTGLIVFLCSSFAAANDLQQSHIDWTVKEVKQITNNIRASQSLKPKQWPNNSKAAVLLSFDVDNETLVLRGDKSKIQEGPLSSAEYGANIGMARIIQVLKNNNIPVTFFIPAMMLDIHPETITQIQKLKDFEVGIHGWIHEVNSRLPSYSVEKALIEKSIDKVSKAFGKVPVGYRAPSWNFSSYTLEVIKESGFLYDSSLMASDDPYELCQRSSSGKSIPSGMLELPVSWILDDYPWLEPASGKYSPPREVLQVYKDEFDRAYAEGGVFSLTMHPHVIGRRSRILILEQLVEHMVSKGDVWFATHADAADYIRQETSASIVCPQ